MRMRSLGGPGARDRGPGCAPARLRAPRHEPGPVLRLPHCCLGRWAPVRWPGPGEGRGGLQPPSLPPRPGPRPCYGNTRPRPPLCPSAAARPALHLPVTHPLRGLRSRGDSVSSELRTTSFPRRLRRPPGRGWPLILNLLSDGGWTSRPKSAESEACSPWAISLSEHTCWALPRPQEVTAGR